MYEFKYQRPGTVRQAANILVKDDDAKIRTQERYEFNIFTQQTA